MKFNCLLFFFILAFVNLSAQTTYNFTGNGNWSVPSNWSSNTIPPNRLPSGSTIIINPQPGDSCVLNVVHKNLPGSNFVIASAAKFIVPGGIGVYSDSTDLVTKVKKILHPIDSVGLLCFGCPIIITQKSDYYIYDSLNRIKIRKSILTTFSNNPITIDTVSELNYIYEGNDSKIISYTSSTGNTQLFYYDALNRLIKDSAQNPLNVLGKIVRTYSYNLDTIFQTQTVIQTNGIELLKDTMITVGNNITFERLKYTNPPLTVTINNNFTFSPYRNPYSYVNNFPIFGSDYRTTSLLFTYNMNYSDRSTYNQAYQNNHKINNYPNYLNQFTIGLDAYGRVISSSNNYTGNKVTTFEYY